MTSSTAGLQRGRTLVLWGLLVVWLLEMLLSSVRPLTERWTQLWEYRAPDDARLYLTYAILAAAKGALATLAVYALRSRIPSVRSALYVSMALVPPLNVLFPFRAQGFLMRPTLIGATLSVILWQTFFLFREDPQSTSESASTGARSPFSRSELIQRVWFAVNATALTLAAALFLFTPADGVRFAFPCLTESGYPVPSGVALVGMVVGTHLAALATATWLGTFAHRSNQAVRQAVAAASTLHTALLCLLPLVQLAGTGGRACASSSPLMYSMPVLAGWLIYLAVSLRIAQPKPLLLT